MKQTLTKPPEFRSDPSHPTYPCSPASQQKQHPLHPNLTSVTNTHSLPPERKQKKYHHPLQPTSSLPIISQPGESILSPNISSNLVPPSSSLTGQGREKGLVMPAFKSHLSSSLPKETHYSIQISNTTKSPFPHLCPHQRATPSMSVNTRVACST